MYVGGLIFYIDPAGTKTCVTAADLIDLDGNMHCFMLPFKFSIFNIKISVVSKCEILVTVHFMNTQLFAFSF